MTTHNQNGCMVFLHCLTKNIPRISFHHLHFHIMHLQTFGNVKRSCLGWAQNSWVSMCKIWQFQHKIPKHWYYVWVYLQVYTYMCIYRYFQGWTHYHNVSIICHLINQPPLSHCLQSALLWNYKIYLDVGQWISGFCGFLRRSDKQWYLGLNWVNVHPFHLWSDSSAMISLFPQLPRTPSYICFSFSMPGFCAQIDKLAMYSDCARPLFQMTFFNCFPLLEFWSFTFVRGVWIRSSLRISFLLVNLASKFSKDPYHRVRFLVLDYSA